MKLEVEYDQLKHQLSPVHQKAASSPGTISSIICIPLTLLIPERSTVPSDYSRPPLPPSVKPTDDPMKTRLMEKKQQQWKQENCKFPFSHALSFSLFQLKKHHSGIPSAVLVPAHRIPTNLRQNSQSVLSLTPSLIILSSSSNLLPTLSCLIVLQNLLRI